MKLSVALDGYWLSKRLDMSPHTVRDYRLTFRRLVGYLGDVEIESVTTTDIRRFLDHLAGEYDLKGSRGWLLSNLPAMRDRDATIGQYLGTPAQ